MRDHSNKFDLVPEKFQRWKRVQGKGQGNVGLTNRDWTLVARRDASLLIDTAIPREHWSRSRGNRDVTPVKAPQDASVTVCKSSQECSGDFICLTQVLRVWSNPYSVIFNGFLILKHCTIKPHIF